jgi:hypothetical protein
MGPEALGAMGMPPGAGVDQSMPAEGMPTLHDVTASVFPSMLQKLGQYGGYYEQLGQMPQAVRGVSPEWEVPQQAPPKEGIGSKASRSLKRSLDSIKNWMSQDVQPTTRWGTGLTPASDVNAYGQPVW